MEVIGAVSSVVALVEATSRLATGLTHLAQRWHNAPEEIRALADATENLAIKFAYARDTVTTAPTTLVDSVTRDGLVQLVAKANVANSELGTLRTRLESYDTIFQRAKWAVKDAKAAKTALATTKDIEEALAVWTSFISLKGHSLSAQRALETQHLLTAGFAEMKQILSTMAIINPSDGSSLGPGASAWSPLSPAPAMSKSLPTARSQSTTAVRRTFGGVVWDTSKNWQSWGLYGTVIKSTKGQATDYNVAVSLHLPMAWWFGTHVLKGQVAVSFPRQNTLTLRHPSYFAVARVLDASHLFFEACRRNDARRVREMLRSGKGRPTDEDSEGQGPLWYAVSYGSIEVVAELLERGADIDTATNREQSTPLVLAAQHRRLDVLRMLLRLGASADPCDEDGTDVYLACWYPSRYDERISSQEIFDLVSEYVALEPTYTLGNGDLTAMHLAATSVSGQDISALISHGHDIEGGRPGGFEILYFAAVFGNSSAFTALLSHGVKLRYGSISVEQLLCQTVAGEARKDKVWLLSTQGDYEAIARHLLWHGEPDLDLALNVPSGQWQWPASIRGRSVTVRQLAEAYGPKTEAWLLTLLRESSQAHHFTKEDKRRLHALRLEGYAAQGRVLGEDEDYPEDDGTNQSDDQSDNQPDADDGDDHDGRRGEGDATHKQDELSDMEEEQQFWDAEQGL